MIRGMCITYEYDGALYINITNRCTNNCDFCIRNNADGAYGTDTLWLVREPTVDEVVKEILDRNPLSYRELVFCGYGEPTVRLFELREIAMQVKERHPEVKVRVNTNGHSDLILGIPTAPLFAGAVDSVSISLNASSPSRYNEICHPVYDDAFNAIINFAKSVSSYVPDVAFSVVRETLTDDELLACELIAEEAGVRLRVRDYIGKDEEK